MNKLFIFLLLTAGLLAASCSIPQGSNSQNDYKMYEETAAMRLTQTFEAIPTSTDTPVPTDTPEPTATATDVPTPTEDLESLMITHKEDVPPTDTPEPTATVVFPDKADFVSVLPSPNQFIPNQHFYLTWQIKNTGTTTWSGKYRFYYSDGIQLADQSDYSISETVAPSGILTITMPATAPGNEGTYQTTWTLENPDGIPFYYVYYTTIVGDQTFITEVPDLNPTATLSSLDWMCSSPERSLIQGDGCAEFCLTEAGIRLEQNGIGCFVKGERAGNETHK